MKKDSRSVILDSSIVTGGSVLKNSIVLGGSHLVNVKLVGSIISGLDLYKQFCLKNAIIFEKDHIHVDGDKIWFTTKDGVYENTIFQDLTKKSKHSKIKKLDSFINERTKVMGKYQVPYGAVVVSSIILDESTIHRDSIIVHSMLRDKSYVGLDARILNSIVKGNSRIERATIRDCEVINSLITVEDTFEYCRFEDALIESEFDYKKEGDSSVRYKTINGDYKETFMKIIRKVDREVIKVLTFKDIQEMVKIIQEDGVIYAEARGSQFRREDIESFVFDYDHNVEIRSWM